MTPQEKVFGIIIALIFTIIIFVAINMTFDTPIMPSLASETIIEPIIKINEVGLIK